MAKKHRGRNVQRLGRLEEALLSNGRAMEEGHKKKSWSIHDIKSIKPLTITQEDMFRTWFDGNHVCAFGSAGTGKTFIALYLALNEVLQKYQNQIIIVRSAVPTREIGHLPGTLEEKIALYERPYSDMLWELIGRSSTYQDMKDAKVVEFMSTSFIRGLTWDNAIVIIDEFQNMTMEEIDSVITRIGKNTRVILCGDIKHQCDLRRGETTGAQNVINVLEHMNNFELIHFTKEDVVRSEFVKSWIMAREHLNL